MESRNFNWQTDEEEWAPEEATPVPPRGRRPWTRLAVVLAALLLLGGFAFWQVNRHLDSITQQTEREVLASYRVIETAVQARDPEILASFLSGRDREWATSQMLLAERGLLLPSRFFDLQPAGRPTSLDVHLTPDLAGAVVVISRPYNVSGGNSPDQIVQMQERFIFRRGRDRWLWAAPAEEFWGELVHTRYEHLSLTYPERDAEIAARLGADLNQLAGRLCRELAEVTCPERYRISVRLVPDVAALLQLSDWQGHLGQRNVITLPTPGLLAAPLDDSAYKALWRGYARYFAAPAIATLTGYQCCDQALPFQRALEARLSQFGIEWAPPMAGALPGETLQLSCLAHTTAQHVLFAYQTQGDAWQVATRLPEELIAVQQVPLAGGAWLVRDGSRHVFLFDGDQQFLVADVPAAAGTIYALGERDPTGTKVVLQEIDRVAGSSRYLLFDLKRCRSGACSLQPLSGRPVWSTDGSLTINYRDEPPGAGPREDVIFLGDENGTALAEAPAINRPGEDLSFLVWLDNDIYGFVRHQGSGASRQPEVVIARAMTGERLKTLALDDLLASIPRGERSSHLLVNQMSADLLHSDGLLLRVSSADNRIAYHILLNWKSERARVLGEPFGKDTWAYPSPDGRWLALYERDPIIPGKWTLAVYDRSLKERLLIGRTVPDLRDGPLWSADGEWLVNAYGGFLSLTAVASGYSHVTEIPEDASCRPLQWSQG